MEDLIQRRFNSMFDSAVEGLWMMTPDGQVSFYNQSFYKQFDLHSSHTTLDNWLALIHPDDRLPFADNVSTHIKAVGNEDRVITQYRVKKKSGQYIWIEATGINKVDDTGEYMVGNHRDITEQKELENSIRQLAYFDKISGLPNRDKLSIDLSNRTSNVTVLTLYVTGIKSYISQYSEFILTDFIENFLACLDVFKRSDGHFYRTSLDTFSILAFNEISDAELESLSNRFIKEFKSKTRSNVAYFGDVYIGAYVCRDLDQSSEAVINMAYQTCEYAVEQSQHNWIIYNQEVKPEVDRYFYVENHIKQAIENDDISIYLQPIIDSKSGQLTAFEALARWDTEEFGLIRPDEFIPLAETRGLISRLGRKVFEKSADFIVNYNKKWNSQIKIHVNISALQLLKEHLPTQLQQIADAKNALPENIVIELTESVLIDNNHQVIERLKSLADMGFPLAMDDFGAGYSSMTSFFKLPFKILKLDRELASQSLQEKAPYEYIQFLTSLCKTKKMEITVEGIETPEMLQEFCSMSVNTLQGYLISKPMPVAQAMQIDGTKQCYFNLSTAQLC